MDDSCALLQKDWQVDDSCALLQPTCTLVLSSWVKAMLGLGGRSLPPSQAGTGCLPPSLLGMPASFLGLSPSLLRLPPSLLGLPSSQASTGEKLAGCRAARGQTVCCASFSACTSWQSFLMFYMR